jgi:hypothetical protein
MADAATEGPAKEGPAQGGPAKEGPALQPDRPDLAGPGDEPPTGGLTAVLGKLRDAAAAHDAELADEDGRPPRS